MTRPIGYIIEHNCPSTGISDHKHHRYFGVGHYKKIPRNYDFFIEKDNQSSRNISKTIQYTYKLGLSRIECRVKDDFLKFLGDYYSYIGSQDTAFSNDNINVGVETIVAAHIEKGYKLWKWD